MKKYPPSKSYDVCAGYAKELIIRAYGEVDHKNIKDKYLRAYAKKLNLDFQSFKSAYNDIKHNYDPTEDCTYHF